MDSTDALSRCRCRERRLSKRLRSRYYTVEANYTDGHKASHGLSATAELLVFSYVYVYVTVDNSSLCLSATTTVTCCK